MEKLDFDFYRGKSVFITGHTTFQGAYLSKILTSVGARVIGFGAKPKTDQNLFTIL